MKKPSITSILTVFFTFTIVFSYAQNFGVKAGYNLSTFTYNESELEEGLSIHKQPGFHLGLNFSVDICKNLSAEALLSFNSKGIHSKFVNTKENIDVETTTKLYYIDLPLGLKYKVPIGEVNVFALGGGYIGSGLYGKSKFQDNHEADPSAYIFIHRTNESPIIFNEEADRYPLKRLDYGLMYGAGLEYKLISLSFQHLVGLTEMREGGGNRHRVLQVSLGYTFKHQAY